MPPGRKLVESTASSGRVVVFGREGQDLVAIPQPTTSLSMESEHFSSGQNVEKGCKLPQPNQTSRAHSKEMKQQSRTKQSFNHNRGTPELPPSKALQALKESRNMTKRMRNLYGGRMAKKQVLDELVNSFRTHNESITKLLLTARHNANERGVICGPPDSEAHLVASQTALVQSLEQCLSREVHVWKRSVTGKRKAMTAICRAERNMMHWQNEYRSIRFTYRCMHQAEYATGTGILRDNAFGDTSQLEKGQSEASGKGQTVKTSNSQSDPGTKQTNQGKTVSELHQERREELLVQRGYVKSVTDNGYPVYLRVEYHHNTVKQGLHDAQEKLEDAHTDFAPYFNKDEPFAARLIHAWWKLEAAKLKMHDIKRRWKLRVEKLKQSKVSFVDRSCMRAEDRHCTIWNRWVNRTIRIQGWWRSLVDKWHRAAEEERLRKDRSFIENMRLMLKKAQQLRSWKCPICAEPKGKPFATWDLVDTHLQNHREAERQRRLQRQRENEKAQVRRAKNLRREVSFLNDAKKKRQSEVAPITPSKHGYLILGATKKPVQDKQSKQHSKSNFRIRNQNNKNPTRQSNQQGNKGHLMKNGKIHVARNQKSTASIAERQHGSQPTKVDEYNTGSFGMLQDEEKDSEDAQFQGSMTPSPNQSCGKHRTESVTLPEVSTHRIAQSYEHTSASLPRSVSCSSKDSNLNTVANNNNSGTRTTLVPAIVWVGGSGGHQQTCSSRTHPSDRIATNYYSNQLKRGMHPNDLKQHPPITKYLENLDQLNPLYPRGLVILDSSTVTIGRSRCCSITLDSKLFPKLVSKQHATIIIRPKLNGPTTSSTCSGDTGSVAESEAPAVFTGIAVPKIRYSGNHVQRSAMATNGSSSDCIQRRAGSRVAHESDGEESRANEVLPTCEGTASLDDLLPVEVFIVDNCSTNCTSVNDKVIEPLQEERLTNGTFVTLGCCPKNRKQESELVFQFMILSTEATV